MSKGKTRRSHLSKFNSEGKEIRVIARPDGVVVFRQKHSRKTIEVRLSAIYDFAAYGQRELPFDINSPLEIRVRA